MSLVSGYFGALQKLGPRFEKDPVQREQFALIFIAKILLTRTSNVREKSVKEMEGVFRLLNLTYINMYFENWL